jgi:hypothetical protein
MVSVPGDADAGTGASAGACAAGFDAAGSAGFSVRAHAARANAQRAITGNLTVIANSSHQTNG